jgi:hypothetical protein
MAMAATEIIPVATPVVPVTPVAQAATPRDRTPASMTDAFLHVAQTVAHLEPLLAPRREAAVVPTPRPEPPRVHIGTVEVVVTAPSPTPPTLPFPSRANDLANRRYLRRI